MTTIHLPQSLYDAIVENAAKRRQTPDRFVEEVLAEHFLPSHAYVEIVQTRSQPRPVIKGTRVGVDVIVGYTRAGYTVHEISTEILPQLTPAQVYDALSYYEDHKAQVDEILDSNSPEAWRERLQQQLGSHAANRLLGI